MDAFGNQADDRPVSVRPRTHGPGSHQLQYDTHDDPCGYADDYSGGYNSCDDPCSDSGCYHDHSCGHADDYNSRDGSCGNYPHYYPSYTPNGDTCGHVPAYNV